MNLGGNKIQKINKTKLNTSNILNDSNAYYYEYIKCKKIKTKKYTRLKDACIFVLKCDKDSKISYKNKIEPLKSGRVYNIQNLNFEISAINATFFVTGKKRNLNNKKKISIQAKSEIYKVNKPWGYELWLTGKNNKNFCFKKIFLKKGFKTSLQYHNFKEETNFLYDGKIKLHYYSKYFNKKNFDRNHILTKNLNYFSVIKVTPPIIHRIESLEDTELYEVSTPHLDDVIRIQDETNRTDGRIESEHKK